MKLLRRWRERRRGETAGRQIDRLERETRSNVARLRALDPEFEVLSRSRADRRR